MPVLTVIAGPNGAGKSTHSNDLLAHLKIKAFDFDKEFYSVWSQFDFDPAIEYGAFAKTQEIFLDRRSDALKSNSHFAFETNYHATHILSSIDLFAKHGFSLELIYICLENPDLALERVKDRVAKGGHAVDEATVRERFTKGLDLLDKTFDQFDVVSLYLSKPKQIAGLLFLEPQSRRVMSLAAIPPSLEPSLPRLTRFVIENG